MIPDHEARRNERLIRKEPIEATVLSCPAEPSLEGAKLEASTLDASATGLQIYFKSAVPHAAIIELLIGTVAGTRTFHLCGIVRWVREREDQAGYRVGIELRNPPQPLLRRIGAVFKRRSSHDELSAWRDSIFESIRVRNL